MLQIIIKNSNLKIIEKFLNKYVIKSTKFWEKKRGGRLLVNDIFIYLRRQQERGLMQKARRLVDEKSVSFQMFLILLSSITLDSESQISVFKQCQSNT